MPQIAGHNTIEMTMSLNWTRDVAIGTGLLAVVATVSKFISYPIQRNKNLDGRFTQSTLSGCLL